MGGTTFLASLWDNALILSAKHPVKDMDTVDPHEQNRRSWNAVTPAHQSHKVGQVAFFRNGAM